jgi:hypothetical protein
MDSNSVCKVHFVTVGLLVFIYSCTTVGRIPLDERSAHRRDLYLTTHNIHKRQTSMPLVGFEPTISACERPQTYALDHCFLRYDAMQFSI